LGKKLAQLNKDRSLVDEIIDEDQELSNIIKNITDFLNTIKFKSIEEEITVLSSFLITLLAQKNITDAKILTDFIAEVIKPNEFFIRRIPTSDLSKTNISRDKWGLDPDLITQNN